MKTKINKSLIIIILPTYLFLSCSEVKDVDSSDWKRYDWMREILGEQVVADSATHNLDTGEYRFVFTTSLQPDSAIAGFDRRAAQSGWIVKEKDSLSRTYMRRREASPEGGEGCISLHLRQGENKFGFRYRPIPDC